MKRYLVLGALLATLFLLVFLLPRHGRNSPIPETSEATPQAPVPANPAVQSNVGSPEPERGTVDTGSNAIGKDPNRLEIALQLANRGHDTPVAFYGLVVDQDSNVLQNVTVDLSVMKLYTLPSLTSTSMTTRFQRQTGADGRFEVTGMTGNSISVDGLTKEGYEPELQMHYGSFGPQSTSFDNPAVLRLWSTNIHEQLITGDKSFVINPDGRHYGIDLIKGTISEGDQGDLVAWIKRPEPVKWGQRYDWSCEVTLPGGGLLESENRAMFRAPDAGYTNVFAHHEDAGVNGWGWMTGDERFYVQLHDGQIYGRIVVNLYAYYDGNQPAMIELSYAVNPSGSRLLR
jgi:hypothetical protein